MHPEVFTLSEAQALQGHRLFTTQDFKDEHERILIPQTAVCQVIGIDAWEDEFAGIAVQYSGNLENGWYPKLVLMNKTTFQQHFEDISLETHATP